MVGRRQKMSKLEVVSSNFTYQISIGESLLKGISQKSIMVCDKNLKSYIPSEFRTIYVESSEKNKTLTSVESILNQLAEMGLRKDEEIVAIGGGLIQDLSTMASAIYMRGVNWNYFPTTLMAMADSCIGGKSSINLEGKKNIIGNFYPPKNVFIDLNFIKSLSNEAIASGLSEAIKICFARDKSSFENFCKFHKNLGSPEVNLVSMENLIEESLKAKKWFVEVDEFDVAERKLLNFGHTFGHALESSTNFAIPHGIAIAIGMLIALEHPLAICGPSEISLKGEVFSILESVRSDLREYLKEFDLEKYNLAFNSDKKHNKTFYRIIVPLEGKLRLIEINNNEENLNIVSSITKKVIGQFL
jgi:3-dehydroquinate synthase